MAIVKLKDVTVTRLNNSGNGVKVVEENESAGKVYKTSYTLWFKEPSGLSVGDVVSVSGLLSAKVGDPWTGDDGQERRSVDLSLNAPRISTGEATAATQNAPVSEPWAPTTPAAESASGDVWNTPGSYSDETPF
ncbi:hypothetical protein EV379_1224 [Microterricola gilva]|uniref:Single-stranded DNA-binding protein n=1 Tax=Microterricola gilva TaxID=393267 RepID=A0A4Q8ALT0_9MICO|nr:hypothetical protein [Microterricola gilva]RZU64913.1 hypothetical protein EV379_1224 [Microterricola gilva]